MSLRIVKSFYRPLALVSAALLVPIGGAVAADYAGGGVQQQMRQVLAGRIATPATLTQQRARAAEAGAADAQELARRLLSGVTNSQVPGTPAITPPESADAALTLQKGLRAQNDAQSMAQRLLMGQRYAVAAGS
jgi:hypothetical protein